MSNRVYKATILLPTFQGGDNSIRIKLPGICVCVDSDPGYIGVLVPGIGMVFRHSHEVVKSGAMIDLGDQIELNIPPQLLPNIIQHERKISMYFAEFMAEHPTNLMSNVEFLSRYFVPAYPPSHDEEQVFLRGLTP